MKVAIVKLENEKWTPEVGPTINDPVAENYRIVQVNNSINLVMCSSLSYSGWLAKQVSSLPVRTKTISFGYTMMTDDCTQVCAQVAETDFKITDDQGWTYDLSAQWEMVKVAPDWMFMIDHEGWAWTDTGIIVPPSMPYVPRRYMIDAALDYDNKQSAVTAVHVDGECFPVPEDKQWIPARLEGWAPNEVVAQLQQCNRGEPGGYTLRFTEVGYEFELP